MRIDESQKTSICRSSTTINQPLTGRNRRRRPRCVNPVLLAELAVVSNTDLSNIFSKTSGLYNTLKTRTCVNTLAQWYFNLCTHEANSYLQSTLDLSAFFDLICDQLKCATKNRNVRLPHIRPLNGPKYRAGCSNRKLSFAEKVCTNNHP